MTMTELAKLAECSQTAVSLVLKNPDCPKVSKAKRERILRIARESHFQANHAAVALRSKKSKVIGIQMPMVFQPMEAFSVSFIQKSLHALGYNAIFAFHNTDEEIPFSFRQLLAYKPDGLIAMDFDPLLGQESIPVVFRRRRPGYDAVMLDYEYYADAVVEIAVRGGHDLIYDLLADPERTALLAAKAAGRGITVEFANLDLSMQSPVQSYPVVKKRLSAKNRPSLCLTSDYLAHSVYAAAFDLGISIPDELSVIGMDNMPTATCMRPPLSSFDLRLEHTLDTIVGMLLERIADPGKAVEHRPVSMTFIDRASVRKAKSKQRS